MASADAPGKDPMDSVVQALEACGLRPKQEQRYRILVDRRIEGESGCQEITIEHHADSREISFCFRPVQSWERRVTRIREGRSLRMCVHGEAGYSDEAVAAVCGMLLSENYRAPLGAFARDDRNGELVFRVTIPYADGGVTKEQAEVCLDVGKRAFHGIVEHIEERAARPSPPRPSYAPHPRIHEVPTEL